jgi:hypothetical protein
MSRAAQVTRWGQSGRTQDRVAQADEFRKTLKEDLCKPENGLRA